MGCRVEGITDKQAHLTGIITAIGLESMGQMEMSLAVAVMKLTLVNLYTTIIFYFQIIIGQGISPPPKN